MVSARSVPLSRTDAGIPRRMPQTNLPPRRGVWAIETTVSALPFGGCCRYTPNCSCSLPTPGGKFPLALAPFHVKHGATRALKMSEAMSMIAGAPQTVGPASAISARHGAAFHNDCANAGEDIHRGAVSYAHGYPQPFPLGRARMIDPPRGPARAFDANLPKSELCRTDKLAPRWPRNVRQHRKIHRNHVQFRRSGRPSDPASWFHVKRSYRDASPSADTYVRPLRVRLHAHCRPSRGAGLSTKLSTGISTAPFGLFNSESWGCLRFPQRPN